ncbi:MAG: NMD3-related protein [Candidatus Micrarchaeia archaeon]
MKNERKGRKLTERLCPICGATETEKEFVDFFCTDCALKQRKVRLPYEIPREILILQCKNCGIYKIRRWYGSLRDVAADIPSLFKGKVSHVSVISLSERKGVVEYSVDGEKTIEEIPIKIHRTLCNDCTKFARGYFESILQLRGDDAWVARMKSKIEKELLRSTFITKEEEFKYGIDLYVGSTRALREALRNMGLKAKTSERLHTAKEGRKLYRVTFLLRQRENGG